MLRRRLLPTRRCRIRILIFRLPRPIHAPRVWFGPSSRRHARLARLVVIWTGGIFSLLCVDMTDFFFGKLAPTMVGGFRIKTRSHTPALFPPFFIAIICETLFCLGWPTITRSCAWALNWNGPAALPRRWPVTPPPRRAPPPRPVTAPSSSPMRCARWLALTLSAPGVSMPLMLRVVRGALRVAFS